MSCGCDSSSTTTVIGCCSIHGTIPSGQGFRASASSGSGATAGTQLTVYPVDSGTALTVGSSNRLWITNAQLIVTTGGDAILYHGTSAGDDSTANRIILGGPFANNGGAIATFPWIRLPLGHNLYVKTAAADLYRAIVHGVYETV